MKYKIFYWAGKYHICKLNSDSIYYSISECDNKINALEICEKMNNE